MAVFFDENDVSEITLSNTGSWETVDLDSYYGSLPGDTSGGMFVVYGGTSNTTYGIREYNNTNYTYQPDLRSGARVSKCSKCDSSNRVEIFRQSGDSDIKVWFVGYFTTDASWESSPGDVTPSTTSTWENESLSAYTSGGELFAIIDGDGTAATGYSCRYTNATHPGVRGQVSGLGSFIVPLDGSDTIDIYVTDAGHKAYIVGFCSEGTKRTARGSDLFSSLTSGSYQDVTIADTGNSHEIAILEPDAGAAYAYGLQPDGSTSYPDIYYDNTRGPGCFPLVSLASDKFEAKIEHADLQCFCWGYLAAPSTLSYVPNMQYYYQRRRA